MFSFSNVCDHNLRAPKAENIMIEMKIKCSLKKKNVKVAQTCATYKYFVFFVFLRRNFGAFLLASPSHFQNLLNSEK